ncbi:MULTISPECIES: twin transmembrane helix small protein [Xanthobacter]|uniref:ABC-type Na+ efflux pump permease subunit n=1 Tax=Xanthobacter flavus TaxID=281 RepID=A0A9W6CI27_XANFL|nr:MULTISPECIES: twin transmembrane helix small protein [Xanthobacter]MBN8918155.1 twin transmembrane helix small protein [Hyphomicrobiales bacterium]MDR6333751.1 ABC-type Na+ efflux pump permease subunit [Xanthobacter flavus]NMN60844.1 ABC-type Na+ efflux pump permease subunit [Xanthobacter sp. SG618]UDQ91074.1 twin transmembrane helix small protein [Xanthobacter autotrophicus]UJX43411.1 twin transmembrane helix small protein [Xanthobacter sp. YC-JY1]
MVHWSVFLFIPLALALVAGVLFLGLFNFASGGSPQRSQKLMQMRVLFQFLAIIIVMATIFAMGR